MYPPPTAFNGFYNGGFYYIDPRLNGPPPTQHTRPIKMKRRRRFMNSRNSNSQHSTENTTDYSDEEPTYTPTYHKRFNYRRYNGFHHSNHQYNNHHHYNSHYNHFRSTNRRFDHKYHYDSRERNTHQQASTNVSRVHN